MTRSYFKKGGIETLLEGVRTFNLDVDKLVLKMDAKCTNGIWDDG